MPTCKIPYEMEMISLPKHGPFLHNIDAAAMRQESSRRELAHYMRKFGKNVVSWEVA